MITGTKEKPPAKRKLCDVKVVHLILSSALLSFNFFALSFWSHHPSF